MDSRDGFDAQQLFEQYLLDYFVKNNMHETAEIFRKEANVPRHSVDIDVPNGFLREWWCAFHDTFTTRQLRHQEFETETSSGVPHSMSTQLASDHQRSRQFHISNDFEMIGEPVASLLAANFHKREPFEHSMRDYPSNLSFLHASNINLLNSAASSSRHLQRQIFSPVQQQDNLQGFDLRETTLMDPALYGAQRAVLPITGIQGAGSISNFQVVNMTENLSQVPHSMATQLASDHQRSRQFHISTDFDMIGEPAASLLAANFYNGEQFEHSMRDYPSNLSYLDASSTNLLNSAASSSRHPQQQNFNQVQQQDNLHGFDLRETTLMDPAFYGAQRAVLPIPGILGAGINGGVKPLPPNEQSLNAPNQQHQLQMLTMKHQPQLLAPAQSFTPGNLTLNCPGSSANFACQNLMSPKMNLSGKNAQMVVQMRNSGGHRLQHDQPQHQQLKEKGRRKSKSSASRAKDEILDCTNDQDKEHVDKKVESVSSVEVTVDSSAPSRIVRRKPAAKKKKI